MEAARKAVAEVPELLAKQQKRLDDLKNDFEERKPIEHRTIVLKVEEIELKKSTENSVRSTPNKSQ